MSEHRLVRCDAVVAGEREFASAAQRVAADRRDHEARDRGDGVEGIVECRTDRGRLDSYTLEMEKYQKDRLFCAFPEHRFRQFKKTDGYANQPLDGLWLRAPYLHNGSVPTLRDLLEVPADRPVAFRRGRRHVRLGPERGGFEAPACIPSLGGTQEDRSGSFCFDTTRPGNSSRGHLYGTDLSPAEKDALLGYLLTF